MTVSSNTFISDIVLFLRDYLRTNITDPISRNGSGTSFVFTAYPKTNVQYPIITVKNTNIKTTMLGMQSEKHWTDFNVEVRVWARNSKECDNLAQNIIDTLRNAQYGTSGTSENLIFGYNIPSVNSIIEGDQENTIHSKIINYNYKVIL